MSNDKDTPPANGRWQRREKRLRSESTRMAKHGADMRRVYADAVRKRLAQPAEHPPKQ